jgi:(2Fe-2S) ferredoxin
VAGAANSEREVDQAAGSPRASEESLGGPVARYRVHLCFGPNCTPRGSRALLPVLQEALLREGLTGQVEVIAATCRDRCDYGPSMNVYPGPVFYNELTPEAVEEIVHEHLKHGRPVERWFFRPKLGRGGRKPEPPRPRRWGSFPP